jgi:hypothetical protein
MGDSKELSIVGRLVRVVKPWDEDEDEDEESRASDGVTACHLR